MNERLSDRAAAACLRAAVAAPSIHNTQPWRFRFDGTAFDLFADPRRALDAIDPDRRGLHISVGAAACNLRVALAAEGWVTRIERPGPGGAAARITPVARHGTSPATLALAGAIARRRTNREPFTDTVVPAAVLDALRRAAAADGIRLVVLDPVRRGAVLALTSAADAWQRADPRYRRELSTWTTGHAERRDGVPVPVFGPRSITATLALRDFGLQLTGVDRDTARFETHPRLVVLHSRGEGPDRWLDAGRALERVLLTATVHGLAAQPMTQALEVAHLRRLLAPPGGRWFPQMILRIGYGRPVAAGPRRPLRDVLLNTPGVALPLRSTAFSRGEPVAAGRRHQR
ncbi:nitroreductase family protein [Dactylosporangium sp. NPDC051485]|uniref:Acg family FMN-binding oxidoreductase n=1 Tax=Dactylosporangium sp. NPDC051485 TaxID=3154846 RepID=UPI003412D44B